MQVLLRDQCSVMSICDDGFEWYYAYTYVYLICRSDNSVPSHSIMIYSYDEEPYQLRTETLQDSSFDITPYAYADVTYNKVSDSTFQSSHLPNEPVNLSDDRSAPQNVS